MKMHSVQKLAAPLAACFVTAATAVVPPAVEQDWLLAARLSAANPAALTTQDDAAGGCDGVKDGKWGFHTLDQNAPWWQVDLGRVEPLARVVIWNRCDGAQSRAARLELKLSDDKKTWRTAYAHDGKSFGGVPDGKPLAIALSNAAARFVRVQLPGREFLHFDEVELFGPASPEKNLALHKPADQSSLSQWSRSHIVPREPDWAALTKRAQEQLARIQSERAASPSSHGGEKAGANGGTPNREDYLRARTALRPALLSDPLFNFDDLLFVKRAPGSFSHMSDQYYGWWSRPGGGVFLLRNWRSENAKLVNLTPRFAPGNFLKPELSHDAKRVLFSYCKFHPHLAAEKDKTAKKNLPEDAFYHVFEMNIDGSGLRQLTHGRYDDFNARYLPNGEIVFLSTRRGIHVQTGKHCATETLEDDDLPDSFVRCGGGKTRPVAVYTLHVMNRDGRDMRTISPFENFEWDPVVANDGRVVYARWDYVDRDNMPYMSLWSTMPDGTNPQIVYGNHTVSPHAIFEARPVPNSRKFVFTASAHHSISGGSLCLLDTDQGNENSAPLTRLTPEVPFPEIEAWPRTWYHTPFPLSESLFLTAWSPEPMRSEGKAANPTNSLGLYVYHASGARELIYRDPEISCSDPIPVRARPVPAAVSSAVAWDGAQEGRYLLLDVYQGLEGVERGTVKALRVVGVPAKVQPEMNTPNLGVSRDDPGKFVLGTVPVERDGSAHFRVPSGVNIFFQALDARGLAIQTMRTVSYVQPGQTLSCVGCHEHRATAPGNGHALAALRAPSRLTPPPEGAWPFRYDRLVQPVVEARCVRCHQAGAENKLAAQFDLTAPRSYEALLNYGKPSLRDHVNLRYREGRSKVNGGAAQTSALLAYLDRDPVHRPLLDAPDRARLLTWIDVYGQRLGSYSTDQEQQLTEFRGRMADLIEQPERKP
jgi:hypothetical protein